MFSNIELASLECRIGGYLDKFIANLVELNSKYSKTNVLMVSLRQISKDTSIKIVELSKCSNPYVELGWMFGI